MGWPVRTPDVEPIVKPALRGEVSVYVLVPLPLVTAKLIDGKRGVVAPTSPLHDPGEGQLGTKAALTVRPQQALVVTAAASMLRMHTV